MKTTALSQQNGTQTLSEAAVTRFIEDEQSSLLVVRELDSEHCVLADGRSFRFAEAGASAQRRREISAMLFGNIVRVRSKELELSQPINGSAEKRRLFERFLPVKENFEGIFLAKLRPDGSLEDLCSAGGHAGYYSSELGWYGEN